jgi:hypothetical protein
MLVVGSREAMVRRLSVRDDVRRHGCPVMEHVVVLVGTRLPTIRGLAILLRIWLWGILLLLLRSIGGRVVHWHTSQCRGEVRVADARVRVHALDRSEVAQVGIGGGLLEIWLTRGRARVVRNEVQMLAGRSGDAERLLHEPVGLIPVPLRLAVIVILVTVTAVFRLGAPFGVAEAAATLSLHLTVGQKAAGHAAGAPRLAVRPTAHARFPLVPNEHRAGSNALAFFFRKSSLHSRKVSESAGLEEPDCVRRGADHSVICFHVVLISVRLRHEKRSQPFPR